MWAQRSQGMNFRFLCTNIIIDYETTFFCKKVEGWGAIFYTVTKTNRAKTGTTLRFLIYGMEILLSIR